MPDEGGEPQTKDRKGKGRATQAQDDSSTEIQTSEAVKRQLVDTLQAAEAQSEEENEAEDNQEEAAVSDALELGPLTSRSLAALRSLVRYGRRQRKWDAAAGNAFKEWPSNRRAAVMVALFGGRTGELNVLLSTRSLDLRINPGEVALPGGKMETTDMDLEHTARREAFEEIGLPMSKESVRLLCHLPPFLSRSGTPLLVTPVVCLSLDPTVTPNLNLSEVSNIFSHPLYSFLTDTPPPPHYVPPTVYNGTRPYRMQYDIRWLQGRPYRLFRFEGRLNPIWGFTADILIHTAMVAYRREPDFERKAPGQMRRSQLIEAALDMYKAGTKPDKPRRLADSHASSKSKSRL